MAKPEQGPSRRSHSGVTCATGLRWWMRLGELKRCHAAPTPKKISAPLPRCSIIPRRVPCVLFDEIPNFKPGYRVLANSMGSRKRQAVTLGHRSRRSLSRPAAAVLARTVKRFRADSARRRQARSGSRKYFARRRC